MPQVGEIRKARDIGRVGNTAYMISKFIWANCGICGKERWVRYIKGNPVNDRCQSCSNKINGAKGGLAFRAKRINENSGKPYEHHKNGYVYVYVGTGKFLKRARLIVQEQLGMKLSNDIDVHHINGIKDDDRPENLLLISHADHRRYHAKIIREVRQSKETLLVNGEAV